MKSALRSLLILLWLMLASHAAFAEDIIIDQSMMTGNSPHRLSFLSAWETGQTISAFFAVKPDKSGIIVWGFATDDSSPVVATEIVQVMPGYTPADCPLHCVSIAQCASPLCNVDWPSSAMPAASNQILFYLTNATGARYGATTTLSKPVL